MFRKENRISRNKDFDRVFKTGQSFYGQVLSLKAAKNDLDINRFGILISTKVSKKAVIRNRYKRQLREVMRQENAHLNQGYDIVFVVFPSILDKDYLELTKIVKKGLKKLSLYK